MMCQRIGRPPMGSIGFGTSALTSLIRVPRPPQRMTVGTSWAMWLLPYGLDARRGIESQRTVVGPPLAIDRDRGAEVGDAAHTEPGRHVERRSVLVMEQHIRSVLVGDHHCDPEGPATSEARAERHARGGLLAFGEGAPAVERRLHAVGDRAVLGEDAEVELRAVDGPVE